MYKMILGVKKAPWEDRAMLRDLGQFKRAVLALLERDPLKRMAVHEFVAACERGRVLAHSTSTSPIPVAQETTAATAGTEWSTANESLTESLAGSSYDALEPQQTD